MHEKPSSEALHLEYHETDLAFLRNRPHHFRQGVYMVCNAGRAVLSTGVETFHVAARTELIFLTGSLLNVMEASDDFRVRMLSFPQDLFLRAMAPIETPYLNYSLEHPCYAHTDDARSRRTWRELNLWLDLAAAILEEGHPPFGLSQEESFLRSLLMWLFGTIPDKAALNRPAGRQQELCTHFLQLLREHGRREHGIAFYASRLCISPRYLDLVTRHCLNGRSPKRLIEEQLLAEVKVLLSEPGLPLGEIAQRLHFPDQSYLWRFVKRTTGLSPGECRRRLLAGHDYSPPYVPMKQ